ncbi:MAG TPA: GxxExxY protein [Chitinophagaceae bacterium]|jgi:GxxExxY protein|nr:GxxExxY protein [Chitinophagaceae bacterium]
MGKKHFSFGVFLFLPGIGNCSLVPMKHKEITDKIIKAFYKVYNILGYGFLEKVYLNALSLELTILGLRVEKEKRVLVYYCNHVVGDYKADLIVENRVAVETKAIRVLIEENEHQLLNYLKATTIEVGLLLNFGTRPQFKRKLFDNDKKRR